jgi:hypothetical protein
MDDATTPLCEGKVTLGLDPGDKRTQVCVLGSGGEVLEEARLRTTPVALRRRFPEMPTASGPGSGRPLPLGQPSPKGM